MKTKKVEINPLYYVAFIISRMLDIISTLINTNKWGWEVEGNPIQSALMAQGHFFTYQFVIAMWVIGVCLVIRSRVMKTVLIGTTVLSVIVAIYNTIIFLVTSSI